MVDLGADEATRQYAVDVAHASAIRLRWLPIGRRLAPGPANRLGFAQLSTPFIALLDNDVVVPSNWLGPTLDELRSGAMGMVAPLRPDPFLAFPDRSESTEAVLDRLKSPKRQLRDVVESYLDGRSLRELGQSIQQVNQLPTIAYLDFPSALSSCCLLLDREAVEAAGGIADPRFDQGYGSEDIDLSWRVMTAGYDVVRTSDVFVLHLRHTSLEANRIDYQAELRTANQTLYQLWRTELLAWARDRLSRGDDWNDLAQRFIVRELLRNTSFETELFPERGRR